MKKVKQIVAIFTIVVLIGLYVWSLVAAILARPEANTMFMAAMFCTVAFPVLLYVYTWFAKLVKQRAEIKKARLEATKEDLNEKK